PYKNVSVRLSPGFNANLRSSNKAPCEPEELKSPSKGRSKLLGCSTPPAPKNTFPLALNPSAGASSERRKVGGGFRSSKAASVGASLPGGVRNGSEPFSRFATVAANWRSSAGS